MSAIKNYHSLLGDPASQRFETFSYLPQLDEAELRGQIQRLLDIGLVPIVEHVEPERIHVNYWYMWKLPMFGEKNADQVLGMLEDCRSSHPGHHVRLSGHNPIRQTREAAFVVHRATVRD